MDTLRVASSCFILLNIVFSMIDGLSPDAPQNTFLEVAREIFADGNFNWGRVVMLFYFAYKMAKQVCEKLCCYIDISEDLLAKISKSKVRRANGKRQRLLL